ncbi:hypothetical protein [Catenovulum sediminis]|uniref:Uncharacterized protein n=1 Tax=Catenovulum sediminis TaxID=1740262 RepID=A0ABV1RN86_9ALTE
MTVYIKLDGQDDYLKMQTTMPSSFHDGTGCDAFVRAKFRVDDVSDSFIRLLSDTKDGSAADRIILETNGDRVIVQSGGGANATWNNVFAGALQVGDLIELKVETVYGSTNKRLYINDVDKGTRATQFSSLGRWLYIGANYGERSAISVEEIEFNDSLDTSGNTFFSAADSARGAGTAVLTETLNNNHATMYNGPTDGSAWESTAPSGEAITVTLEPAQQLNEGAILSAAEQLSLTVSAGEQLNQASQQQSALSQVFATQPAQQLNEGAILSAAEQLSLTVSAGEQLNEGGQQQSALSQVFVTQTAQQLNEGATLSAAEPLSLTLSAGEQLNQASPLSGLANQTFVMRQSEQLNQLTQLTTATTGVFVIQTAEQLNEGGAQQSPIQMQFVIPAAEQLNQAISLLLIDGIKPVVITSAKVINKSYSASVIKTNYTAHLIKNQLTARVK